jgi:NAD(P)-dependent dehydrogenase (short-subunit alcohol dehydrogenase family)
MAEQGADIIAIDVCRKAASIGYQAATPDDLHEMVTAVEATGKSIVWSIGDVRDQSALDEVVARGVSELGGLDIVVGNAASPLGDASGRCRRTDGSTPSTSTSPERGGPAVQPCQQ